MWYDRQEAEMDNLRAAMAWSLNNQAIEMGLRMASALRWVWEMRGHHEEGLSWMEKLLPLSEGVSPSVRAKALHRASEIAGQISVQVNTRSQARNWGNEALTLARTTNDKWNIAWALSALGFEYYQKDFNQSVALFVESIALFRELNDPFGLSHALRRLALVAINQGNYPYAQTLVEEALTRDRKAAAYCRSSSCIS